jgi:chromosome partitioning protein
MVLGVTNLKGGVGKTTISQNLAVAFAHEGYSVCLVDTDRNQNSMQWYEVRSADLPNIRAFSVTDAGLTKSVDSLRKEYDIVIIDGTPSLEDIATRIILVSDLLLIPLVPSAHDLRTLGIFFERFEQAKSFRDDLKAYFFLNYYEERELLPKAIEQILGQYDATLLDTKWKRRAVYRQSAVDGRGVVEDTNKKATEEVKDLMNEILKTAREVLS